MRMVLLALVCFSLIFATASAMDVVVPGDADGDMIVSDDELELAEQSCSEGKITSDELEEIKHIHEKYPITILDSADREVTIYKPVKRMISQGTYAYEAIFLLNAQDRLSAVTSTAQRVYGFIPGIKDIPDVGIYREIDYEKVIENQPDLYIIGSGTTLSDIEKKLEPLGTTIVVLGFSKMSMFEKEFSTLARLLEEDEKLEEYLSWRNGYLNMIQKETADIAQKPRVYVEYSDLPWKTPINSEVTNMAGGFNIASSLNITSANSVEVSPEWVITENPEVIVIPAFLDYASTDLTGYHLDSTDNARMFIEDISRRAGWEKIDAVKNGRVYVLDGETGASCRGVVGVCYCAKWFYPEFFKDLDPDAINKEYFEEWLGVPYQGVWAYPLVS